MYEGPDLVGVFCFIFLVGVIVFFIVASKEREKTLREQKLRDQERLAKLIAEEMVNANKDKNENR